jgi:hypothetical protein
MGINRSKKIHSVCSTLVLAMFFYHILVLFLFHSYNKILLDACLAHVLFLFLFFLFHNLDFN